MTIVVAVWGRGGSDMQMVGGSEAVSNSRVILSVSSALARKSAVLNELSNVSVASQTLHLT